MRGLKGKVAAVTGAGSGIGQAAAIRLAEEGCKVAVLDWKGESAETTAAMIRDAGGDAIAVMVDVSDEVMRARLDRVRGYCMMLLKTGPNYQPPETRPPEMAAIVLEHGRRNMGLQIDGKMPLVGPVVGARPVVGFCVFAVPEAEARDMMAGDPALKAGFLSPNSQPGMARRVMRCRQPSPRRPGRRSPKRILWCRPA